jgi:hypothetical protein
VTLRAQVLDGLLFHDPLLHPFKHCLGFLQRQPYGIGTQLLTFKTRDFMHVRGFASR